MPLTNFPSGVASFGVPQIGSGIIPPTSGKYIWVSSLIGVDSVGRGTERSNACKTINYAVTLCKDDRADVIIVMPGHVETIVSATSCTLNKKGVTIVGFGVGSNRPTFRYLALTSASLRVNAANILISNCIFDMSVGGLDAVAVGITLTGANFTLADSKVVMNDTVNGGLVFLSVGSGANGCTLRNVDLYASGKAGATQAVLVAAPASGLQISGCYFRGDFTTAPIYCTSTNHATDILVRGNWLWQINGTGKAVLNMTASSTGLVTDNRVFGKTWATAADAFATAVLLKYLENYGFDDASGVAGGVLVPAAGTIA